MERNNGERESDIKEIVYKNMYKNTIVQTTTFDKKNCLKVLDLLQAFIVLVTIVIIQYNSIMKKKQTMTSLS